MIDALFQILILFGLHLMHEACLAITTEFGKIPVGMIEMIEERRSNYLGCRRQSRAVDSHTLY